ncbi:C10 family peptidase, partial [Parabacteroides sp. OttesenSCG-928-N08]|nr:C10 family peptidase [Parabacteroides sp. OttesenSCG-928-N08]
TGYFGYDRQQIDFKSKQYYSDAKWKQMIRTEIDAQRPILYFGQSSVGGHAFVCDGYNNGDKYHINWGWGGYGNGYYALDVLQADDMGNYSNDEQIIIQIMKDEGKEEPESPLLITDAYGGIGLTMGIENVEKGERFQIEVASLVNRSEGAFKGYVSAVLINARGVIKEEIGRSSLTIDSYSYLRRHKLTCEIATNQYLYADDRIGLATSTDKGESWQLIPGGVNVVDRLKVMDNELTYCTISWQKPEEIVAYPTGEELRTRVLYGQDYAFTLRPDPQEYEVKANNTVIVRDASGIYTIPNVKSNQRITIAIPDPVIDVESVTLNPRQVEMKKGETVQLEATVLPQDATNKALYWSSAKPSVATVSTTGKLTALNAGTTTITAKWRDGNVSDLCEVTVASPTGIEERDDAGVQVICRERLLTLSSSTTEIITLFSVNGTVCMPLFKAPGEKIFDLSSLPAGIFILKSNSGWQQKIRLH